jgi:hypothetical protein
MRWALIRGKVTRQDFQRAAVLDQDEKQKALETAAGTGESHDAGSAPDPQDRMLSTKRLRLPITTDASIALPNLDRVWMDAEWANHDKQLFSKLSPGS